MDDTWTDRIEELDEMLFESIMSQTSLGCRHSLLAVQRAVASRRSTYSYLEIGSFHGGSLQTHLVDERCTKIYSIDPRPDLTPDDIAPGVLKRYADNSSEHMMRMLENIGHGDLAKIVLFDSDASEIETERIEPRPNIAFIDGEHTSKAVISDFSFCESVLCDGGVVIFHDIGLLVRQKSLDT